MPQIENVKDFKKFLDSKGIEYVEFVGDVDRLQATQTNFDKWKVKNIQMDFRKNPDSISNMKPIVYSIEDQFVLDGHHRYKAALNTDTRIPMLGVRGVTINQLLKIAQEYTNQNG